jgi:hypothetical protein
VTAVALFEKWKCEKTEVALFAGILSTQMIFFALSTKEVIFRSKK